VGYTDDKAGEIVSKLIGNVPFSVETCLTAIAQ
jgi:hypothetical protein